jgi:hypothetical protein
MSNRTPSLLEPESYGGENCERGLNFQESTLLAYLPGWLALDGFCQLTRESIGDTEAAIFVPSRLSDARPLTFEEIAQKSLV